MMICFIDFEVNKAAVAYEIKLFSIFKMTPAKPLKIDVVQLFNYIFPCWTC